MSRLPLVLFALPLVVVGAAAGWLAAQCRDSSSLEDADLRVERITVASGENAYELLAEAALAVAWPEDADTWLGDAVEGAPNARERATALVAANERVLELADAASAAPDFQIPELTSADLEAGELLAWRRIVTLLCLRAWIDADRRNTSAALDGFVGAAELGHRMAFARGGVLVHLVVGLGARDTALRALRSFADRSLIETEDEQRAVAALERLEIDPAAWRSVWYAEYATLRDERLAGLRFPLASERAIAGDRSPAQDDLGWLLDWIPADYMAQPNRTMERSAALTRRYATLANGVCVSEAPMAIVVAPPEPAPVQAYLLPNGLGDVWNERFERTARSIVARRCGADARLAGTRTHLALRAYFADHAELPPSLDALVPRYVDALPLDPFSGEALRYSRERRLVWSVGRDGRDSGGLPGLGPNDVRSTTFEEPTFELAFGAPLGEPTPEPIEAARR